LGEAALTKNVVGLETYCSESMQSVKDVQLALDYGMDGIVVSNHGGRQVDGAYASLEALVEIVDAVQGRLIIGFDSGIRCGADNFKALAIGADFVQIYNGGRWGGGSDDEALSACRMLRSSI
jgi:lactate 2-monooxygenase